MSLQTVCMCLALAFLLSTSRWVSADQPNVLIVMADDCTYNDLPMYGGKNAQTPNLTALAAQSITFQRAYVCEAMCQPCRAELYTGQYPMTNGCAWNHSASRADVRSMPHVLGELGYRVGLCGKVHVKPETAFPFEVVEGFDKSCVREPTRPHRLTGFREFVSRKSDQPFCLVVALVEPHVPWVMGDATQYPADQIDLPPNIADTPRTREAFGRYLAEITYMDGQVGELLQALEESGRADDTLVLFTSEQGAQFPGCKWTNWDTGLHTALIARWPGQIAAGTSTDALVQYADVLPTLVELAGGSGAAFDGTSFAAVLSGQAETHHEFVFGMHNNLPEGPAYPIRTASNGEYRLIRNLRPDELYIEKHLMGWTGDGRLNNPYWATWVRDAWDNEHINRLVNRYMRRPPVQLYHTASDPYELNNLVEVPEHAAVRARLADELDRWMLSQGDPGAAQDTQDALRAARDGMHKYGPSAAPESK